MSSTLNCQVLYLWCMASIYLFAFTSLYFQIPGLYGSKGILPAETQLKEEYCNDNHENCAHWASEGECQNNPSWMLKNCELSCHVCQSGEQLSLTSKLQKKFTLLWLSPYLGLNVEAGMEFICILGIVASLSVLLAQRCRNRIMFVILWLLYFSVYQVGQTFLWFQWDILLLETGFLTIFVAPWLVVTTQNMEQPQRCISFWLVRWLLFRLMLASGIVKLTSMCPTWWGLTALNWHYESQCIPTPLAWYFHQFPDWFQRLSTVVTYVVEMVIPFLFFAPVRSVRLFSFYSQILLQVLIILTGNYNFFNLLTITLCISLIDDDHLRKVTPKLLQKYFMLPSSSEKTKKSRFKSILSLSFFWFIMISLLYWTKRYFNIQWRGGIVFQSEVAFSKSDFLSSVKVMTNFSIVLASVSFAYEILLSFYRILGLSYSITKKVFLWLKTSLFAGACIWLFCISLVPFTDIERESQQNLWPIIHKWYSFTDKYQITNSYGLFRRMTGVGGRPELVIEGSMNLNGGWKEYNFVYKPGNVTDALPIVAPHQPRLDWQMWFAALGSYNHNPWFVHLIYKLLIGEKDVIDLLGKNPFPERPPKYIRSILYTYHYTRLPKDTSGIIDGISRSRKIKKWWKRDSPKEYTPPLTKDNAGLKQFISEMGWSLEAAREEPDSVLYLLLNSFRKHVSSFNPTYFMLQLWLFTIAFNVIKYYFYKT